MPLLLPTYLAADPNRQPPGGLIALARNGLDQGDRPGAWEAGFAIDTEQCGDGLAYSQVCQITTGKALAANPDQPVYTPVTLVGFDQCSTLDRNRDRDGRARRHLLATQSHGLELVFWDGQATDDETANGGDRQHLADGTAEVISATATPPVSGMALLDQALTACLHGTPGMVHVTPYALARLKAMWSIDRVDGRFYTPNGHLVVAGSGYPGTGPRAAPGDPLPPAPDLTVDSDQWVYGTPMVTVLLGEVTTYDDIDPSINHHITRAERPAAAFHGGCCKFAVHLDFTP